MQSLPCVRLFQVSVVLGLLNDRFTRRCSGCATVTAGMMSGVLRSREMEFSVDIFLGATRITVLAPAIWKSLGVHVSPHHKPARVNKELQR